MMVITGPCHGVQLPRRAGESGNPFGQSWGTPGADLNQRTSVLGTPWLLFAFSS